MFQQPNLTAEYGRDISATRFPLRRPIENSPRVLVIGGGVTGLVTAWMLLDKGYKVTILAAEWANNSPNARLTAQIAGALWEFPPAVCGSHTNETSLKYSKSWCMVAYHIWAAIAADIGPDSGVRMKKACFYFPKPLEKDPRQLKKMLEIQHSGVFDFSRSAGLIKEHGISPSYGAVDAYEHLAPIIDTDITMYWLMDLVAAKGAVFRTEAINTDLLNVEKELLSKHNAAAIVNASGLGSAVLANDPTVYPLRGALLRLRNDGTKFPKITAALTISADAAHDSNGIVFLVPRNDDTLILGGIAQPNQHTLDLTLNDPVIKQMRTRCEDFLPGLKNAELIEDYPFAQGLRPARAENVRVEREKRQAIGGGTSCIVHNYGHGGSGWSLSFGCAADVLRLVEQVIEAEQRKPITVPLEVRARL